jgi:hypothetical protein
MALARFRPVSTVLKIVTPQNDMLFRPEQDVGRKRRDLLMLSPQLICHILNVQQNSLV